MFSRSAKKSVSVRFKKWREQHTASFLITLSTLLAILSVWIISRFESFQRCVHIADKANGYHQSVKEDVASFLVAQIGQFASCLGTSLNDNGVAITALATVVLTASTIGLWIVTGRAAKAAVEGTKVLPVLERAYVFLDDRVRFEPNVGTGPDGEPKVSSINFWLINHGKTPAVITGFIHMQRWWHDVNPRIQATSIGVPKGLVIGPGCQWEFPNMKGYELSEKEWHDAKQGIGHILLAGRIYYEDIFGQDHITGFCWEYNFELGRFLMAPRSELNYQT